MGVLNLNSANKIFYGNKEIQRIYKEDLLIWPKLFSPLDLSPTLWLDADDPSTITTVSGAVSEWRDKSGNNRHATQSSSSSRPLLGTNALNNTTVIEFDGVDDWMSGEYNSTFNFSKHSIFIVNNYRSLTTPDGFCSVLFPAGNTAGIGIRETNKWYDAFASFSISPPGVATLGTFLISTIKENNSHSFFVNGDLTYSTSLTYSTLSHAQYRLSWNSLSGYYSNDISQILIFDRTLTQTEREKVEGYLAHKTGLQANLTANHPYKTVAP